MSRPPKTTLPAFAPVPRKKKRADGWTAERQRGFIEALAETGSVKSAARAVGKTPETAYYLRRQDGAEEFRAAWEAALDLGVQKIEDVAMDRALNGVEQPVFAYGELVGFRRVYNDQLLMFMLRNRAPHRFAGDRAGSLSGMDKQMLARLKKEWRREWEREQGALQMQRELDTIASIYAKIDRLREKEEAHARLEQARRTGEPTQEELDEAARADAAWDAMVEEARAAQEERGLLEGPEDDGPRIRTVKDMDWG